MSRKCRNPLTSNELFELYKTATGSEKEAIERRFISKLQQHARGVCYLRLRDTRPDLANTATEIALRKCRTFEGRNNAKFSSWFQRIVENLINNEVTKTANRKETLFDDLSVEELNKAVLVESDPDIRILVEQLMRRVTAEQQELMRLKLEGLTLQEIATKKRITTRAVMQRWHRLKQTLRKQCEPNAFV